MEKIDVKELKKIVGGIADNALEFAQYAHSLTSFPPDPGVLGEVARSIFVNN